VKIVALEEHFATAEVMQGWKSVDPSWSDLVLKPSAEREGARRLLDFGAERLDAMNEAGIDVAVLSLTTPGVQNLDAEVAVDLARSSNDHLAAAVHTTPERFQGFATLPTPSPDRANQTFPSNLFPPYWPVFSAQYSGAVAAHLPS